MVVHGTENGGVGVINQSTPVSMNLIPPCEPAQPQALLDVTMLQWPEFNVEVFPVHGVGGGCLQFLMLAGPNSFYMHLGPHPQVLPLRVSRLAAAEGSRERSLGGFAPRSGRRRFPLLAAYDVTSG